MLWTSNETLNILPGLRSLETHFTDPDKKTEIPESNFCPEHSNAGLIASLLKHTEGLFEDTFSTMGHMGSSMPRLRRNWHALRCVAVIAATVTLMAHMHAECKPNETDHRHAPGDGGGGSGFEMTLWFGRPGALLRLSPEDESFLETMRAYQQSMERDAAHLRQNTNEMIHRGHWDGGNISMQEKWQKRSTERFERFPDLGKEDLIPVPRREKLGTSSEERGLSLGDFIKHTFVVSLERRPLKRQQALRELEACGLAGAHSYLVNAVDGDGIKTQFDLKRKHAGVFPGYNGHKMHQISLSSGEAGCFMSHYSIWLYMHRNNISSALILEDDFEVLAENAAEKLKFRSKVGEILQEISDRGLQDAWDLLYLSRYPVAIDYLRISKNLCIPGFSYWTIAYILTLSGARKLLNADGLNNMIGLDDWFSVLSEEPIDERCVEPYSKRYRSFFKRNLRRLAVVPPLIMPSKGAFLLSDTAKIRNENKFIKDLPLVDAGLRGWEGQAELAANASCMRDWKPSMRARAPGAEPAHL